ncbi:GNAT family N-acetyltransferase [Nonomuraea sp. NPDC050404]|uniref:GNAT family N-acetyltransferase n=1 Tax=Nonomuraea sp. NPDC050404 TaxID=3155783 RepID=UPI00340C0963
MIRELRSPDELRAACGDDDLVMWAGQGLRGGARAWALHDAVVAGSPLVSRRDRLAVWGGTSGAVRLVRHALGELGATYRPLGETELMRRVVAGLDGVRESGRFSWMTLPGEVADPAGRDGAPRDDDQRDGGRGAGAEVGARGGADDAISGAGIGGVGIGGVGWLDGGAEAEVAALLAADAPHSYAVPGASGVTRWAGVRVDGVLAAVAAEAWSAPTVGLLAGVATRAGLRGRGLAERVCRWVSAELVAAYGRAALMVDDDNPAAIGVYERIGYRRRRLLACHVTG